MSGDLIKSVFSVCATLFVSGLLFFMLYTSAGQNFLWNAVKPPLINQWEQSTMDNGAARSQIYEDTYKNIVDNGFEYSRESAF